MLSFESRAVARNVRASLLARAGLAVLAAFFFAPHIVTADEPEDEPAPREAAPAESPRHAAGLRVYVDPETGRRSARPPADAVRADGAGRPEFSQSSEGLVERPAPGGGVNVDLQGRFQSSSQVRINAEGERELFCNDPLHGHAGHAHALPAAGPEER